MPRQRALDGITHGEAGKLQIMGGGLEHDVLGQEADQFAARNGDALLRGTGPAVCRRTPSRCSDAEPPWGERWRAGAAATTQSS